MFHSSSFRHEQYLIRSGSGSKHTLHKKLPSLDSKISAVDTDSECSSSSSSPTYSTVSSPTLATSFSTTTSTLNTSQPKKTPHPRRKKRTQTTSQRPPDLVYSCPRPLAFPFHNDDHFLPIAEADPRDVARVAPQVNRSHSIQSKDSLNRDSESSFSRHSSILSSIQQGTVRSIRSLFSLQSLSQLTTATTATQGSVENTTKYQPLERLEIKQGTVQSLLDFFTRGQQPEDKKSDSVLSCPLPPPETDPANHRKSLYSRASEFASRALWGTPTTEPTSSALESQPEAPEPRKSLASEIKKFSVRVISSWMPIKSNESYTKVQDQDEQPSKVGKLWNSFKSFMTGKKSSRVGPISI